jgi:hypothetical protein
MKKLFLLACIMYNVTTFAQGPAVTSWLQNTTGIKGRHYVSGNSTPIQDNDSANVQQVFYSSNWVYVRTKGIPSYITGPYLDGNPSVATSQNAIFKISRNPIQNTGTPTNTTGGNIGIFINGVALFDYRDGVSWKNSTNSLCGGPIMPPCMGDGIWNRDAVVGERLGFDCSKGHPAMGNYHHHQNPSAFNLDLNVISTVCNLYTADALYTLDSSAHSPLIGFAYDGFPIYGAYAYKNLDGTGGIVRMKSSYTLRNITTRTTYANGTTVTAGPAVSTTYPLGYFREDYQYNTTTALTPDYLDEHNGRFCVTPEYPSGIYCYFATVDKNWNSAYPYIVGPTFYGVKNGVKVTSITESVTQYTQGSTVSPTVTALNCAGATFSSTATINVSYNGSANVPYNGGNGVSYTAGNAIASSGVTGLTAILQPGNLTNGTGSLNYNITGTPTSSGTANFTITFGGQTCTLSLTVNNNVPVTPAVTTLNCNSVTVSAGTVGVAYNGNATIPYSGGNAAAYSAGTAINSTGVTGLTAILQSGTLASGNGSLVYVISGTPATQGTANFSISFGGQTCSFSITINNAGPVMPEILSLNCAGAQTSPGLVNVNYNANALVAYTGGNGAPYPMQGPSVSSTGVTGLTAVLQPGVLNSGDGTLIFLITGTPSSAGVASFAIDFGGQACVLNVLINSNAPLVANLDCGSAVVSPLPYINIQYSGTATVPYSGGNGSSYSTGTAISSTGVTGLTATLQGGTLTSSNGNLVYNISGMANATGTAAFTINFGGQTCTFYTNVNAAGTNNVFGFNIQPNPAKNFVNLVFYSPATVVDFIAIYDASGRKVYYISHPDLTIGIDVSKLSKGNYIIKAMEQSTGNVVSKKFVKL